MKGFGHELRGQEEAGRMLAEYVDKDFRLTKAGITQVKEKFVQPVYVHGVGCGKSALLGRGLSLLKKYCRNKDLSQLLEDNRHPLAIHISFNSKTPFSHVHEKNVHLAVIRRILASCLGLDWDSAIQLPLSESLRINDCVRALMVYHRTVHGMKSDQMLFVYLGIDEINHLVYYPEPEPGTVVKPDINSLKRVARAVQSVSPTNGFVSTLLAGTNFVDMTKSFLGSGIDPFNLKMTSLSKLAIESMLISDAGVSQKYIDNPRFQKLLRGIGPVMRAVGIAVSKLDYEYSESSIAAAESSVRVYLAGKREILNAAETQSLFGFVLTGRTVRPIEPICENSLFTFDNLQNAGTINLVHCMDDMYSVSMSRIMLDSFLESVNGRGYLADSARRLFGFIDSNGPDSFEKFVAHFYGMKKEVYSKTYFPSGTVPLRSFYAGALIGDGMLDQEVHLKPTASVSPEYVDGVMWLQGERYPETAEPIQTSRHLKNGGVLLNSKGAAIDVLASHSIRDIEDGSSVWKEGVTAYAVKHTIVGGEKLTNNDITADREKALKALSASANHSKALVTMVHFSNRELSEELHNITKWKPEMRRSVVVCRSNIESVVGPMFGRMLISKGFYGIGKESSKSKSFSTLAIAVMSRVLR